MLKSLTSLYRSYEESHMEITWRGGQIVDQDGATVGYIDIVQLRDGRLRVQGWVQAVMVRLVRGAAYAQMAPILRRPDVATALNIPETVGFDLSIPALVQDLTSGDPAGLSFTREAEQSPVSAISLPLPLSAIFRMRTKLAFMRDICRALPAGFGWMATGKPFFQDSIKQRLRLRLPPQSTQLEPEIFWTPDVAVEQEVPAERVTIVLPVYNAFELLKNCLDRVERHTDLPYHLIVVEDCSTDPRILPFLRDLVDGRENITLLENQENQGFIASANRALAHAMAERGVAEDGGEGPVILLNSDALVPEGWASRLVRPFYRQKNVATVTPMSNYAEIFSVPQICARTVLDPGQGDEIDRVAQGFNQEALLTEAPTGVGFCMAISRDWLAREPQLDVSFGRGYGEEVDWCQKIARLGGRNLVLPGLFVEHLGGESFGNAEKLALIQQNNAIITRRYPSFDRDVQTFIATDPVKTARLALGLAWAGSCNPGNPVPVYLAHSLGGGADLWLESQMAEDLEAGRPSVVLRVGGPLRFQLELVSPHGRTVGETEDADMARALLGVLPHRRVIYSCGVGDRDPAALPALLVSLMQECDAAEVLFHDFFPLSPSFNLLDQDGAYRGPVVAPRDDPAHTIRRSDGSPVSLEAWQAAWKAFASMAELTVFSSDGAKQVAAVWPDLAARVQVRPHRLTHTLPRLATPDTGNPPVLAVLGSIGVPKGATVVQALARQLDNDALGIRIVLIGIIDPFFELPASTTVHGPYAVHELPKLAEHYAVTHWLIPSVCPETFSYAVHEALSTGLPVLAFDIGAQGVAVSEASNGMALPYNPDVDLAQTVLEAVNAG